MELVEDQKWKSNIREDGKLKNPGKSYFLKYAADAVRDINKQMNVNGMNYARKAMIRYGLSLNINGDWEVKRLSPQLQKIVTDFRENFERKSVTLEDLRPQAQITKPRAISSAAKEETEAC